MKFTDKIEKYFDSEVRRRGAEYFNQNKLSKIFKDREEACAFVEGSRAYQCTFAIDDTYGRSGISLLLDCECPHFSKGSHCKHLWALALGLDGNSWPKKILDAKSFTVDTMDSSFDDFDDDDEDDDDDDYWGDEDEDDDMDWAQRPSFSARRTKKPPAQALRSPSQALAGNSRNAKVTPVSWEQFKTRIAPVQSIHSRYEPEPFQRNLGKPRSLQFVLDAGIDLKDGDLSLRFFYREHLQAGKLGVFKPMTATGELEKTFIDPLDIALYHQIVKECDGFKEGSSSYHYESRAITLASKREGMQGVLLQPAAALKVLLDLADKGKLFIKKDNASRIIPSPLKVSGEPWDLEANIADHSASHFRLQAVMARASITEKVEDFKILADGRFVIANDILYPSSIHERQHQNWIRQLTLPAPVIFPKKKMDTFVAEYSRIPLAPNLRWPQGTQWVEEGVSPRPRLRLKNDFHFSSSGLVGSIIFQYPDEDINSLHVVPSWVDLAGKRITSRDFSAEREFLAQIYEIPAVRPILDPDQRDEGNTLEINAQDLVQVVEILEAKGWDVDIEGRHLRVLTEFNIIAEGETDWFDLSITTNVDGQTYKVPQLLKSKAKGSVFIPLGKNNFALLPEVWLKRFEVLQRSGKLNDGTIRIPSQNVLLLDSLLAELEVDNRSQHLRTIREKIKGFKALEPIDPPTDFRGELRDYQKEGLAWLEFLQDFGFGGCLSDEMGLGKTIQVLAMLLRYHKSDKRPTSLIVMPRSLVGNWMAEAEKFCPTLSIRDLSGNVRDWKAVKEVQPDLVVTTYGMLRQDIKDLLKLGFGYVVLDESQTIKNQSSQAAKAAYLLKSQHRLAISGTPIENHLSELMSLMTFLNPGLLTGPHWMELFKKKFDPNDPHLKNLTTAIRPLMLRRTKAQVLKDLPEKIEDTLYCDLSGEQKKHYDELRLHYQMNLLPSLRDESWKKSSIVVIEALLRLRQAACHSGLVDPAFSKSPSSKLEVLFDKLQEIRESGHKALVFSQFTSLLKIVSARLEEEGVPFEYLDGSTRDRAARVSRFQNDPKLPVFLISLKAGGVGLNLTAADYCFILDPWWNPAAEAQAIDRAHRINQKNTVFAYRLIARDTVEEKIQILQKNKRAMVESVLEGEGALLQDFDLKTIQSLFS